MNSGSSTTGDQRLDIERSGKNAACATDFLKMVRTDMPSLTQSKSVKSVTSWIFIAVLGWSSEFTADFRAFAWD